jgi:hypothetical protein
MEPFGSDDLAPIEQKISELGAEVEKGPSDDQVPLAQKLSELRTEVEQKLAKERAAAGLTVREVQPPSPASETNDTTYASFESDQFSASIAAYNVSYKMSARDGRTFYQFDNGRYVPLMAVIFDTPTARLVSLNDIVIPLTQFLDVIEFHTPEQSKESAKTNGELRSPLMTGSEYVQCTTSTGKSFVIPRTNVPIVMKALITLTEAATGSEPAPSKSAAEQQASKSTARSLFGF